MRLHFATNADIIVAEVNDMAILHVRNVPEDLHSRLKERADAQRRSLSAEVITLLEWAIEETERTSASRLASIRRRRFFAPDSAGAPDSTRMLSEDRGR
ncbi:MAG: FitA-like ribbon-helix-helix domain-containing protein [Chloroflexota bacterium]